MPICDSELKRIENKKIEIFPQLPFAGAKELKADEKTEKKSGKIIELNIEDNDFLETASEIKFKTLFLDKFPIKYRNFSKDIEAIRINNIGFTQIDFGFEKLNNVQIRLFEYPQFKMIELKKRDFKVALGVNAEGTLLLQSNDLFEYEIYGNIKNNRLKAILNFFIKLFSGSSIKFHLSNVVCDIDFVNHIESFKFTNILEILENYEALVKAHNLNRNKDLTSSSSSFYSLTLLNEEFRGKTIDTWINLKMQKPFAVNSEDTLILNRLHKFNLKNLSFNLLEKIELKKPLVQSELLDNKIQLNRRAVKITFKRIKKQ